MSDFPMQIHVAYKERQHRAITFFKWLLAIPWLVWWTLWSLAFQILLVLAWFILLFTAKWPREFFSFALSFMRYQARISTWIINLTDAWPSWNGRPDPEYGLTLEIERQERYNRWKTFFRFVLTFPLSLLGFGVGLYAAIFWFLSFWAIVFTGRMPRWCYDHLANTFAWSQRVNAYQYYLIERFPPFAGQDTAPPTATVTAAPQPVGAPPPAEAA